MPKNIYRPLAWAQLSHQKTRLAVGLGGIAFANILIFMQLGFLSLFSKSSMFLPESLAGDLFIINPKSENIGANNFDRIRLDQAAAVDGVIDTAPLYISPALWAYGSEFTNSNGRLYAFNLRKPVFRTAGVKQQISNLSLPNAVLFDRLSKPTFGPIAKQVDAGIAVRAVLNNHRVEVTGLFSMGSSPFLGEGNIMMSEASYADIFGEHALNNVGVGIVWVKPTANLAHVKAGIKATVPGIEVLTYQELVGKELEFQESKPTGPIFSFGTIMGFVVGIVIVYQVLYADISDHLAEYATLKAIGYSDWALLRIIFMEAIILAVIGFIPGWSISIGMYVFLAEVTRLELVMTAEIALAVFSLTVMMCIASATIASIKLRSADPADVF